MKYIVVIANGLTDHPVAEKDNQTPLQIADTPNLDRLVQAGGAGAVRPIPEGFSPGNEISYLSMLGYDPSRYQAGAASFAARAIGIEPEAGEIPLCCDFVTLQSSHNDMVMKDFTAGHLSGTDARPLLDALQENICGAEARFFPGQGHQNLVLLRGAKVDGDLTPPFELVGEGIRRFLPEEDGVKDLVYILNQAQIILHNHPFNVSRRLRKLDPVNSVWLYGRGNGARLPAFEEQYGKTAGTVSGSLLFRGMARAAGMQVAEVPGATGFSDTDFKGKVEAALRELENRDVVFLHVAAGEDVSLKGLIDEKILVIEDIDREVVGPLAQEVELRGNVKLLVTSNHFCSAVKLKYGSEPVPFLVYPSRNPNGAGKRFGETLAGLAAQRVWEGPSMISEFLKDQL